MARGSARGGTESCDTGICGVVSESTDGLGAGVVVVADAVIGLVVTGLVVALMPIVPVAEVVGGVRPASTVGDGETVWATFVRAPSRCTPPGWLLGDGLTVELVGVCGCGLVVGRAPSETVVAPLVWGDGVGEFVSGLVVVGPVVTPDGPAWDVIPPVVVPVVTPFVTPLVGDRFVVPPAVWTPPDVVGLGETLTAPFVEGTPEVGAGPVVRLADVPVALLAVLVALAVAPLGVVVALVVVALVVVVLVVVALVVVKPPALLPEVVAPPETPTGPVVRLAAAPLALLLAVLAVLLVVAPPVVALPVVVAPPVTVPAPVVGAPLVLTAEVVAVPAVALATLVGALLAEIPLGTPLAGTPALETPVKAVAGAALAGATPPEMPTAPVGGTTAGAGAPPTVVPPVEEPAKPVVEPPE